MIENNLMIIGGNEVKEDFNKNVEEEKVVLVFGEVDY